MNLVLPLDQRRKLEAALEHAGALETGGQLFGEQLAPSSFKVVELTTQRRRGSFARFIVDVVEAGKAALAFFRRTNHNYARYNYIGEWHSHPSFSVQPSSTDAKTMRELVASADFRGTFAVLMIARLDGADLQARAWLYDPRGHELSVNLEVEDVEV